MNGPHDVGGQMGFGPIAPEPNEPMFHADWERRALGVTLAAGMLGAWNIDESRHARENRHPADYYSSTYYQIWIKALERLMQVHGFASAEELRSPDSVLAMTQETPPLGAASVPSRLARGGPVDRPASGPALFLIGDAVRTVEMHPSGHTRLPRYVRGRVGRIEAVQGVYVFPDTNAHGLGEAPQWLYTVTFDGRTLWGRDGDPNTTVSIDAFEPYLLAKEA